MQLSGAEARALLEWYIAMGIDCAVGEAGIDRFGMKTAAMTRESAGDATVSPGLAPKKRQTAPLITKQSIVETGDHAVDETSPQAQARRLAATAQTLEELRALMEAFDGCALKKTANNLVFSDGMAGSPLMLIGEAPGRDEDIQGKPFVGRSGQLLDRILAAIGMNRSNTYIANVVPWRPPANRTPTSEELAICLPFITRHIELAAPRLIVLLGGVASTALTGSPLGIVKLRGQWQSLHCGKLTIKAMPTFHPAYLLRNPISKRLIWKDFLSIQQAISIL